MDNFKSERAIYAESLRKVECGELSVSERAMALYRDGAAAKTPEEMQAAQIRYRESYVPPEPKRSTGATLTGA